MALVSGRWQVDGEGRVRCGRRDAQVRNDAHMHCASSARSSSVASAWVIWRTRMVMRRWQEKTTRVPALMTE